MLYKKDTKKVHNQKHTWSPSKGVDTVAVFRGVYYICLVILIHVQCSLFLVLTYLNPDDSGKKASFGV